jgi:hypothetical protein
MRCHISPYHHLPQQQGYLTVDGNGKLFPSDPQHKINKSNKIGAG